MDSVKHYLALIYDPLPIMYFMSIRKLDEGDLQIMDAYPPPYKMIIKKKKQEKKSVNK